MKKKLQKNHKNRKVGTMSKHQKKISKKQLLVNNIEIVLETFFAKKNKKIKMLSFWFCYLKILVFDQSSPVHPV